LLITLLSVTVHNYHYCICQNCNTKTMLHFIHSIIGSSKVWRRQGLFKQKTQQNSPFARTSESRQSITSLSILHDRHYLNVVSGSYQLPLVLQEPSAFTQSKNTVHLRSVKIFSERLAVFTVVLSNFKNISRWT